MRRSQKQTSTLFEQLHHMQLGCGLAVFCHRFAKE
jgi:hypothetical protein